MSSSGVKQGQRVPKYIQLVVAVLGLLILQACGATSVDDQTVAAESETTDGQAPVTEPDAVDDESSPSEPTIIEGLLVGTEWDVVDMSGFPADAIIEGTVGFTSDQVRFDDGINQGGAPIDWTNTGFTVGEVDMTAMEAGQRYLRRIFGDVDDAISVSVDGQTLTLNRADLVVVAEQR